MLYLRGLVKFGTKEEMFDSDIAVEMARACDGLLTGPPSVDLWEPVSAQDVE